MSEWKEYRLGELYEVHNGLSKGGKFFGSGYPFLTFSTVFKNYFIPNKLNALVQTSDKERTSCNILEGDIFVTRTSETAEELGMSCVALHDYPDATYNGFTKRLRKKESCDIDVDSLYIGYYLRSKRFRSLFYGIAGGMSTRASLANNDLLNMVVCLPTIQEQIKIGQFLFNIDSKIECNRKICANLEAQAQALFKHWFIDFAPFKEGKFVESELGMIPEGWRVYQFPDFISPSGEKVGEEGIPEYSVTNTGIHPRDEKFKKNLSKSSSKNKLLRKFDLVFGMSREILNWGVMEYDFGGVSPAYHIFRVDQNKVNSIYLKEYISHKIYYFKDLIRASTREGQSLDKGALFNKCIYVPPTSILNDFFSIWNLLKIEITNLQAESSRLSLLRDTLLPKLMSGQIKV